MAGTSRGGDRMRTARRLGAAGLILLGLAGCSTLPAQGPSAAQVLAEIDATPAISRRYLVTDLSPRAVEIAAARPRPTLLGRFGERGAAPSAVMGIGDVVQVTVWEAATGGLFSTPNVAGVTAGSHSASFPEQTVSRDGTITVPYAGVLRVAGKTPHQAEALIVAGLAGKAIEPQAIVSVTRNASNTATVLGDVTNGARVPLSLRGDRVLDVIAAAGGVRAPIHESFVVLSRGDATARVPMQTLVTNPRENVYVHPGDILTVVREPQTFTAFGAAGHNALVPFDAVGLSLEEAVAKAGGLIDSVADPQGVFLMRSEPVEIARRLDPSYPIPPDATAVDVVYRVNLRDAATYFTARRFPMRNKDVMYVAASPSTEFFKALQLFGAATSPVTSGFGAGAAF